MHDPIRQEEEADRHGACDRLGEQVGHQGCVVGRVKWQRGLRSEKVHFNLPDSESCAEGHEGQDQLQHSGCDLAGEGV